MKWSEKTWKISLPIYEKITMHPFIEELTEGTLDKQVFEHYIQQDALYLAEYRKVLLGIAARLTKLEHSQAFSNFANDTMIVENDLHESFFKLFQSSTSKEQSPNCLLYTGYLLSFMGNRPVYEALAAVLPCFWIYKEVGDFILSKKTIQNNPYQSWINTYGGEAYGNAVKAAIAICDEIADSCTVEQQKQMTEIFKTGSKMEWMFWDGAYHLKKWEI